MTAMRTLFLTGVALLLATGTGRAVPPAEAQGCSVRGPDAPLPWEKTAVAEFVDYLDRVSGGRVIVNGEDGIVFHVGDTDLARSKGLGSAQLADEAWAVRSFGRDVVVNGGGTRGCLYAVYAFLENVCGVRWWSDGDEDVPAAHPLVLPELKLSGRPHFRYRDIFRDSSKNRSDPKIAIRNRLNGNGISFIPPEYGGGCVFGPPAHCHSWDRLLPFSEYGREHPEWYSLQKDGRREGGQLKGQLCLSCPGLPEALAERVEAMIEKGAAEARAKGLPAPWLYDISMNDNKHYCQCESCRASQEKYGISGDQLIFENKVAAIVGRRHPEVRLTVFAYYEGEEVPKGGVRAADNLIVRLTNTKQNMAAGIFEPDNRFMHDHLADWTKYARNVFVWDYSTTFYDSTRGFPVASEWHLAERIRYFADQGVQGMLIEQEVPDRCDLDEFKYYLQAKFLEDPTRDHKEIMKDFASRYYGAAGAFILRARRYLDRIRKMRQAGTSWFPGPAEFCYVHDEDLAEMSRLWDEAEKAVAGDAKRLGRARRSRRGLDALRKCLSAFAGCRHAPEKGVSDVPFVNCPAEASCFTLHNKDIRFVDDSEASTGKAVFAGRELGDHYGFPFDIGVYSQSEEKVYRSKTWTEAPGEGYQWYDVGEVTLPRKSYFVYLTGSWTIQTGPALPELIGATCRIKARVKINEKGVFVDRVVFIPRRETNAGEDD